MAEWFAEVIVEDADPKDTKRAEELLDKLTEYKPLAKIEELEEQNYNMIDNVLNNGCEKFHREDVKKEQDKLSRPSLKVRLTDKKAQVARQNPEENNKNKHREMWYMKVR